LALQPGIGKVTESGSMTFPLLDSTTFILTATGPGGTQTASVRVTVTIPQPPLESTAFGVRLLDAYFDYDSADLRADAEKALAEDARLFKDHQSIRFTIEGKCDDRGSEEYNLALGEKRATAARNYLVNAGVSAERIHTISYGKSRPVSGCSQADLAETCWQQNRVDHFHYGPAPRQTN
jgi:peptidoglycan-associated lipoprotein